MYDGVVISFCCLLFTVSDILGKVDCSARDVNGRPLAAGIEGLEEFCMCRWMCFPKIVLMLTTHATNALFSLSMTVCGSSDDAQHGA